MPTEKRLFKEIAMDFVKELLESKDFHAILVVTDQFIKVQHYILAKTMWTAKDVANSYINNIWKLYGLLIYITLNHGLQFASNFLTELNWNLNINLHPSTAHHPQTDELSEQAV